MPERPEPTDEELISRVVARVAALDQPSPSGEVAAAVQSARLARCLGGLRLLDRAYAVTARPPGVPAALS